MRTRTQRWLWISLITMACGCGTPEVADDGAGPGDEWADSTRAEYAGGAAPRLLGLDVETGTLARFRDEAQAGGADAAAEPAIAGRVWAAGDRVVSDLGGRLYVVDGAGDLWLVRVDLFGAADAGTKIAEGWGAVRAFAAGGDGVLYTVDDAGAVRWWRHFDGEEGEVLWDEASGRVILDDLGGFAHLASGGDGVLYTVDAAGDVRWFLHLDPDDGDAEWAEGSGAVIARGWQLEALTSAGDGLLYGVGSDGEVRAWRHADPVGGAAEWAAGSGRVVARGFTRYPAVVAYTPPTEARLAARAALVRWGMYPAASDAYRKTGLDASRITQTIGNAAASAGYHARDGYANGQPYTAATDISTRGLSLTTIRRVLERMGRLGFAAFYRWPGHDGWPASQVAHIHAVYAGCTMKSQLRGQVVDWLNGRNGLASHGRYTFMTFSATAKNVVRTLFNGGTIATGGGGTSGGASGGSCVPGGFYCGGDKLSGDPNTLYRCNGKSAPSVVARCANGCSVNAGRDDSCRAPSACVRGGSYCGGDKVNGLPDTLYRCNGSSAPSVIRRCANGCAVRPGQDDACR